ncbi:MAG TPA: type II secretion system ATPase GspE [Thermodesulfobacteriota bacterium]|nr:type II secretion system ATPase GspE [Thermodesulfobacteriota bacterium]
MDRSMRHFRRPLGEILKEEFALTDEQLEEVSALQRSQPTKLGELLVQLKTLREEDVLKALGLQLGLPFRAELADGDIDPELAARVPITFAKKHLVLPLTQANGTARVAVADPFELYPLDDLRILLGSEVTPVLVPSKQILAGINRVYDRGPAASEQVVEDLAEAASLDTLATELEEPQDLLDATDEAPIIRLVNSLLYQAVKARASDIHVEPYERELVVRFRIDGVLYNILSPPKRFQSPILSRIKVMGGLNIAEKRLPQDGRIRIKIAGKDVDIRLSVVPTAFGERAVLRLLDKTSQILDLADIGMEPDTLAKMERLIRRPNGIILVTGPTGSGKTTTLYAALSRINSPDKNIITVEDPIEYQIRGVGQIQVNPKIDLTFANGLRSILRQDPDVIMVGEIRDTETAEIAIHASLTGHLVFSTLHTNDAPGAITRLVDMGIEPFLVSSSVIAILAQRLVRLVCPACVEYYRPSPAELVDLGIDAAALPARGLARGRGCTECMRTGYRGRTGIYELMLVDAGVRELVMKNADAATIRSYAVSRGMRTLREDGLRKLLQGRTTAEEVLRVTQTDTVD